MQSGQGDAGHLPPWKSETKTWAASTPFEFFDFVPLRGGKGGRVVVDRFILVISGTITVGTANWDGRDVPRLIGNTVIEQRDGRQRWNLTGYKSRIMSIKYNGIERHQEHADVVVGAGQAVELRLVIPMTKRYVRRPKDFALPADVFKKVIINTAALASAQTGTAALSAGAFSMYVLAEWHEENSVEFKSEDVVKSIDFTSNTQAKASLSGAVHDMDIVRETTTAGGGLVTGITDARCDDLGIPLLTFNDLKHAYTERRAIAPSSAVATGNERFTDPYRGGQALSMITATPETSLDDGKIVETLKVDVGTGAANLSLITREVVDKSQSNYNAQVAMFGVQPQKVKTAAKSKPAFADHSDRAKRVYPWSAPLKMAS
jgi:hypothetical protein